MSTLKDIRNGGGGVIVLLLSMMMAFSVMGCSDGSSSDDDNHVSIKIQREDQHGTSLTTENVGIGSSWDKNSGDSDSDTIQLYVLVVGNHHSSDFTDDYVPYKWSQSGNLGDFVSISPSSDTKSCSVSWSIPKNQTGVETVTVTTGELSCSWKLVITNTDSELDSYDFYH